MSDRAHSTIRIGPNTRRIADNIARIANTFVYNLSLKFEKERNKQIGRLKECRQNRSKRNKTKPMASICLGVNGKLIPMGFI